MMTLEQAKELLDRVPPEKVVAAQGTIILELVDMVNKLGEAFARDYQARRKPASPTAKAPPEQTAKPVQTPPPKSEKERVDPEMAAKLAALGDPGVDVSAGPSPIAQKIASLPEDRINDVMDSLPMDGEPAEWRVQEAQAKEAMEELRRQNGQ